MYKNQIIGKAELTIFESSLAPHQKAVMSDGLTLMERGIVEHNMIAVSQLYQSVYITELGRILGVDAHKAEKIAANMIMDGSLNGSIDQVEGLLEFYPLGTPQSNIDKSITNFCTELNRVVDLIKMEQM
jgi:COP9 signalosome complex subunit 4